MIRKQLNVQEMTRAQVEAYAAQFENEECWSRNHLRFSRSEFERIPDYQWWIAAQGPAVLVVHGTSHWANNSELSWLSPAALNALNFYDRKGGHTVAYAFMHTTADSEDGRLPEIPTHNLASRLILQLLKADPAILQDFDYFQDILGQISSKEWVELASEKPFEVLASLISRSRSPVIIIDRIDACNCSPTNIVMNLLDMIALTPAVAVKVLVVIGDLQSFVERNVVTPNQKRMKVIDREQERTVC